MDLPYNLDYYFDDHLREVPVSKTDMVKGIEFLKKQSHKIMKNSEDLAKVYSLIGVYSRILYDIEDSKKYLTSAIKINEQLEYHKYLFVNKLRLAHTFQWGESFDTSNSLFKELIRLTENNDYLDFLFQHYGKNLFDQK